MPLVGKNKSYLLISILSLVKDKSDFLESHYFVRSLGKEARHMIFCTALRRSVMFNSW